MAGFLKSIVYVLCVLCGVQALNKDLRIGSGGRTIHDFRREVRSSELHFSVVDLFKTFLRKVTNREGSRDNLMANGGLKNPILTYIDLSSLDAWLEGYEFQRHIPLPESSQISLHLTRFT